MLPSYASGGHLYLKASSFMTVLGGRVGGEGEELVFLVTLERTAVLSCHRRFSEVSRATSPSFGRSEKGRGRGAPAKARGEDSLLLARGSARPAGSFPRHRRRDGDVVERELDHPPHVHEEVVGDERYRTPRRPESAGSLRERNVGRGRGHRVSAGAPVVIRLHGRVAAHDRRARARRVARLAAAHVAFFRVFLVRSQTAEIALGTTRDKTGRRG